jgi:hypothetical protein
LAMDACLDPVQSQSGKKRDDCLMNRLSPLAFSFPALLPVEAYLLLAVFAASSSAGNIET